MSEMAPNSGKGRTECGCGCLLIVLGQRNILPTLPSGTVHVGFGPTKTLPSRHSPVTFEGWSEDDSILNVGLALCLVKCRFL
jgi:hypothetical protein